MIHVFIYSDRIIFFGFQFKDTITFFTLSLIIERVDDNYVVNANYESRVELIGNVDVVLKFENNIIELTYR